jgi:hypothetical protein
MQKLEKDVTLHALMIDDLDYYDKKILPDVRYILNHKIKRGEDVIDIVKFCDYFNVTELSARKLIYNIEIKEYHTKTFKFINGDEAYFEQDKIRDAQVQKRKEGQNA